jgi:hypothetical protein
MKMWQESSFYPHPALIAYYFYPSSNLSPLPQPLLRVRGNIKSAGRGWKKDFKKDKGLWRREGVFFGRPPGIPAP